MIFAEFGTGQVFWSMLWFFLFFIWLWLLISIFGDIFRSDDLSGWGKALWSIFVIFLPYLGVFVYLIARGKKMSEHTMKDAADRDAQFRGYVQSVAPATSTADELARLAELRDSGVLSEAEFQAGKAKALA
jgi:Short C-terminal domain/Phospholipase_D-nuclease N-terminal